LWHPTSIITLAYQRKSDYFPSRLIEAAPRAVDNAVFVGSALPSRRNEDLIPAI